MNDKLSNDEEARLIWQRLNLPWDSPASYLENRIKTNSDFRDEFMGSWDKAKKEIPNVDVIGILKVNLPDEPVNIYFTDVFSFIQNESKKFNQPLSSIAEMWGTLSKNPPLPPVCVVFYYDGVSTDKFVSQMFLYKEVE